MSKNVTNSAASLARNCSEEPSIEQKIAQLDELTEWFYGEEFNLDQALEKYQSAQKMVNEINQDLDQLKNQVKVIADLTQE